MFFSMPSYVFKIQLLIASYYRWRNLNSIIPYREKYDENTPTGGIPICGTPVACVGIGLDAGEVLSNIETLDDIDDFHNFQDVPQTGYLRQVTVVYAGADFGVAAENAKRITVTVTAPAGQQMMLSVYRFNF